MSGLIIINFVVSYDVIDLRISIGFINFLERSTIFSFKKFYVRPHPVYQCLVDKKGCNHKPELHAPQGLSQKNIFNYYNILNQNITNYDCGTLCKDQNNGVPLCCSTKYTTPLLYKKELEFLQKLGDFWSDWKPTTKREKRHAKNLDKQEVYGTCKGAQHCIREQRSISCRTFPLEPYIDESGELEGLVFVDDFTKDVQCPLHQKSMDIRKEYIRSALCFWKEFLRIPTEYQTYKRSSKALRKRHTKAGTMFIVLK